MSSYAPQGKQEQIEKGSGVGYKFSLDGISLACLASCNEIHRNHGNDFSNAVLVRRAIRQYMGHLESTNDYQTEAVETKRARKGVL